MNDDRHALQLRRMVAFIKQEAEDKAQEISLSCEEEINLLKLRYVDAEQQKIREEYERKEKQMEIRKQIEFSRQLSVSRLRVLQAQDDLVHGIKRAVEKRIYAFSITDHYAYKQLLKGLILQGMLKLRETLLLLRCRYMDLGLVKSILQLSKDQYAAKTKSHPPELIIDEQTFLPDSSADSSKSDLQCAGGVILASIDGHVVCDNTLNSRLEVAFRQNLPEIRRHFFANSLLSDM